MELRQPCGASIEQKSFSDGEDSEMDISSLFSINKGEYRVGLLGSNSEPTLTLSQIFFSFHLFFSLLDRDNSCSPTFFLGAYYIEIEIVRTLSSTLT